MKISALGDSALLIDFADESSDPEALLQRALSAAERIDREQIGGIDDVTSAYKSVAVFLSPGQCDTSSISQQVSALLAPSDAAGTHPDRSIEVPVCYDEEFALDAERVAQETGLSFEKVIELHSSAQYLVACIGFMPGFPYLIGLPTELHLPRLPIPRTKVPAGSVAIAGAQAGIYPFESPGGWNIIGRTPLVLFDPTNPSPTALAPGNRLRFRKISRAEFDAFPNET